MADNRQNRGNQAEQNLENTRIFWSKSKEHSIAGFRKEQKDMVGGFITTEASLRFHGHIKATSDPEEIEFILHSRGFKQGDVREVQSFKEAHDLTRAHDLARLGQREVRVEETESTFITIDSKS